MGFTPESLAVIGGLLTGIAGLVTALGAIFISRRNRSGNVSTTDADVLFEHMDKELTRMRSEFADERRLEREARMVLRNDLDTAEKRERDCIEQQRRTEDELHGLRSEVALLRAQVAAFEAQGVALAEARVKLAAYEAAVLVKAEAAATKAEAAAEKAQSQTLGSLEIADPTIVRKETQ